MAIFLDIPIKYFRPHLSSQVQQIVRLTKLAYLMLFELDQTVLLQIDSYGFFLVYY